MMTNRVKRGAESRQVEDVLRRQVEADALARAVEEGRGRGVAYRTRLKASSPTNSSPL